MSLTPIFIKPSKILASFVTLSHLGALVTLYPLDLVLWQKTFLIGLVLLSFAYIWTYKILQRGYRTIVAVAATQEEDWSITTANGQVLLGKLLADSVIWPWVMVLRFKVVKPLHELSVVICRDAITESEYRQLSASVHSL